MERKGAYGRIQRELNGAAIDHLHALDRREEEAERERTGIMVGMIFVKHTVKVEFYRICIHRGSVMERDAGSQSERVDRAVCADVPAFRQRRLNLEGAVLVADQPVIHVHQNSKVIHRRYRSRIKRFRLGNLPTTSTLSGVLAVAIPVVKLRDSANATAAITARPAVLMMVISRPPSSEVASLYLS